MDANSDLHNIEGKITKADWLRQRGFFSLILVIALRNYQSLDNVQKGLTSPKKFYHFIDGNCFQLGCFHCFGVIVQKSADLCVLQFT